MNHYRCSICGQAFAQAELTEHFAVERDKESWPGVLGWTLVNGQEESDEKLQSDG